MSRVQLALNVNDIDEAVSFYTKLFGTGPAKRRPRVRELRHPRAAAQARPAGEPQVFGAIEALAHRVQLRSPGRPGLEC